MQALGAIARVARFVQSAYELDFSNTVDPDSHRANEAQSRFDKVMEMLKTNAPSLSLESGLDSPEYASPEWFTKFIEDHPELNDPHDIDGQILGVYALVGSNEYKKAFAEIDKIDELEYREKAWVKRDVIIEIAATSTLTPNEAFAEIDEIDGLDDRNKAKAKKGVIIKMAATSILTPDKAFAKIDKIDGLGDYEKTQAKEGVIIKMAVVSILTPDKVFAAIDRIKESSDEYSTLDKRDVVIEIMTTSMLTKDEAFAKIDKIYGLDNRKKLYAKSDVVGAKLSIVDDKEKMAKALELGFSNK